MIHTRARAVVLLAAALLVGGAGGWLAHTMRVTTGSTSPRGRRGGWPGYAWMKDYSQDSVLYGKLDSVWRRNECVTDSMQRSRIGAQMESLYAGTRVSVESLRTNMRSDIRSLLPDSVRVKYDSINAASDSTRRVRASDMRNTRGGSCSDAGTRGGSRGGPPGGGRGGQGPN